jgi:PAS domain-containing protein
LLSLMQDTTREHEATEALRSSEERLQLLLDS